MATTKSDFDKLYKALRIISEENYEQNQSLEKIKFHYNFPEPTLDHVRHIMPHTRLCHLQTLKNEICAESIMIYPPGIPMIIPGEIINATFLEDLDFYQQSGSVIFSEL